MNECIYIDFSKTVSTTQQKHVFSEAALIETVGQPTGHARLLSGLMVDADRNCREKATAACVAADRKRDAAALERGPQKPLGFSGLALAAYKYHQ